MFMHDEIIEAECFEICHIYIDGFLDSKSMANLKAFLLEHVIKHKPLISEE